MQLSQTPPQPGAGFLRLSGDDALYDSTTARLCALDADRERISLADLAAQGQDVRVTNGTGVVSLGAWLCDQLHDSRDQAVAARCTRPCSTLVEVRGKDGTLRVSQDESFAQARRDRHEQRNLVNAIQMNGELLKILATKDRAERFEGIADKILAECRRFEFGEAGHGPGRVAETVINRASAQSCLANLLPKPQGGSPSSVLRIALPASLPQSLLDYLATLVLYGNAISPGAAVQISDTSGSSLQVALDNVQGSALDNLLGDADTCGTAGGFLDPARLPATTAAFSLRLAGNALTLDFATQAD